MVLQCFMKNEAIVASRQLPVITQTVFATRSWSPRDFFGGEFYLSFCQKYFEKENILAVVSLFFEIKLQKKRLKKLKSKKFVQN